MGTRSFANTVKRHSRIVEMLALSARNWTGKLADLSTGENLQDPGETYMHCVSSTCTMYACLWLDIEHT